MLALLFVVVGLAVLVAIAMSFFVRRHGEAQGPQPGWSPTSEVFRDPGSDRLMRVWTDRSGSRHYVPDQGHPS